MKTKVKKVSGPVFLLRSYQIGNLGDINHSVDIIATLYDSQSPLLSCIEVHMKAAYSLVRETKKLHHLPETTVIGPCKVARPCLV